MADALKYLPESYYTRYLSEGAKSRKPSPIRGLFPLEATPGVLSLLAGKPNEETFPFTSMNFAVRSPLDHSVDIPITLSPAQLAKGLQYSETGGIPALCAWLNAFQERVHGRKAHGEGWRLSVGSGSQDLIYKACTALIDPGDSMLVETPCYAGVIPIFQGLHANMVEVDADAHGIKSSTLRTILENWPQDKPKPKVLYTVPYGGNPTGMTASLERRKEVLELARIHEFIILEGKSFEFFSAKLRTDLTVPDDPYYFLYYGDHPRYPSYFELEQQEPEVGRVLRFDSFSKILSAGIRIGFVSGPAPLVQAIDMHTASANLQTASLTQVIVAALLEKWGFETFITHTEYVSAFYRRRRDVYNAAMEKYLTGLAEWDSPEAGMFFWFKLKIKEGEEDSESVIRTKAFEKGVIALPGTSFIPLGAKTAFVRASFSIIKEEDIEESVRRLRDAILEARKEAGVV
ncbi:PLP-dependent transferase [Cylindrobasidium torrendii FP15055 ss-10]|uniref:PLP-dependent transferase n=1 Tax=Cylindrobasidium torrendii FP15055 ss-10 TaxID=1314674 RepID=A0A0D7BQF3_9AGAR|nr:PLP-dependent transferase [Cylindrobasidium torrendii FP15055 ss-10]